MNNVLAYLAGGPGHTRPLCCCTACRATSSNLDLAQAIRRAGWNCVIFHYRGAWGSGGSFSLANAREDVGAALAYAGSADAAKARRGPGDGRVVVIGHSMGGYLAVDPAAKAPGVTGVGLLAPWNVCCDGIPPPGDARRAWAEAAFDDVPGRLAGATRRAWRTRPRAFPGATCAPPPTRSVKSRCW